MYNLTYVANSSSILVFAQRVNTHLMSDALGVLFLMIVFFIAFIATLQKTHSAGKSTAVASFIGFTVSLLLTALSLTPALSIMVMLILLAISVAMLKME